MATSVNPSLSTDPSVDVPANVTAQPKRAHQRLSWRGFIKAVGPGLVTGASDDDPSGIATYALAGAAFGYSTLWTALVTFPLMSAIQFVCAKIGLVTGTGIAGILRRHYSRWLLYPVIVALIAANTLNVAADLSAIAAGINLLVPIPVYWMILPIGLGILAVQVWGSYRLLANTFKWLTLSLLAYVGAALLAGADWGAVAYHTLVPEFHTDSAYLAMLVGLLGTTISPYLFFWQASHEVEEKKANLQRRRLWRRMGASDEEMHYAFWDINIGMLLSNVVMFFIILATAATLHQVGQTDIDTAAAAAEALRPLAGDAATILMALGLIGAGVLAVPILTGSAAFATAEAFCWKCGLDKKPGRAKEFYLVMAGSTAAALVINLFGIDPILALYWTAILNGFVAPPLLVVLLLIGNNRRIMGARANGPVLNVLCGLTILLMSAAAIGLVLTAGGE